MKKKLADDMGVIFLVSFAAGVGYGAWHESFGAAIWMTVVLFVAWGNLEEWLSRGRE